MPYYADLYRPPYLRPLRVDTLEIDVSRPRRLLDVRPPPILRRGRSVVRIRTMRRAPRPSPGALLVQKFTIPEKKPAFERPAEPTPARRTVFSGTDRGPGSAQVRDVRPEEPSWSAVRGRDDEPLRGAINSKCVSEPVHQELVSQESPNETEAVCDSEKPDQDTESVKVSSDSDSSVPEAVCDISISSVANECTQDVVTHQIEDDVQSTKQENVTPILQETTNKNKKVKKSQHNLKSESDVNSINNLKLKHSGECQTDVEKRISEDTSDLNLETSERFSQTKVITASVCIENSKVRLNDLTSTDNNEVKTIEKGENFNVKDEPINTQNLENLKVKKGIKNKEAKTTALNSKSKPSLLNGATLNKSIDESNNSKVNTNKEVTNKCNNSNNVINEDQQVCPKPLKTTLSATSNIDKGKINHSNQGHSNALSTLEEKEKLVNGNISIIEKNNSNLDVKISIKEGDKSTSLRSIDSSKKEPSLFEKKTVEHNNIVKSEVDNKIESVYNDKGKEIFNNEVVAVCESIQTADNINNKFSPLNDLDGKVQCQLSNTSTNSILPNEQRLKTESIINKANLESLAKTSAEPANKAKPKDAGVVSKDLINNGDHVVSKTLEKKSEGKKTKDTVSTNKVKKVVKKKEKDSEVKEKNVDINKPKSNGDQCKVTVEITVCEPDPSNKSPNVDKNNNSPVILVSDEEGYGSDTEISVEEEDMETGVKKKKKVIVKKKNGKVKVTPLEAKAPLEKRDDETATAGEIKRQNSKKRLSLVDEQLRLIDERKTSITDEVIAEEAAYLDSMILETMKDAGRRKSSLAFPPPALPEIAEEQEKRPEKIAEEPEKRPSKIEEDPEEHSAPQDNRREQWHKAAQGGRPGSGKTLGKFFRGHQQESSSSSSSEEDEECDVNCHLKCLSLMPNLCGVNQKLIAEALASVRRGRSRKGSPESASTSTNTLTSKLNSSESSESEAGPGGEAGRVTPPATSLPRFREYCLTDFQFLKVLGKGSFGKVLLAELSGSGCYYAVKALKKDVVLEDDDVECTMIERKVLTLGTGHPFFCHLFCTFQTESHLFFVMEYLNGGDLMFHIQESGRFDEGRARFYAAEIVSGLKFLHKWGIVYRDLKLDNVLLDFEGHARIADFGMCKLQIYLDKTTDTFCGTPDYMAPEIIKGLRYNQCVDWWSFGVLLYELMVGQSPFSGCDEDDLFWSVCNEQPHLPRYLSSSAKSILLALMEKDWTKRLGSGQYGAQDVMGHSFFEGLNWSLLERREIKPPYKPTVKNALDTKYFDKVFTQEKPRLTPVERSILDSMDQSQFEGFSYTNPNATE